MKNTQAHQRPGHRVARAWAFVTCVVLGAAGEARAQSSEGGCQARQVRGVEQPLLVIRAMEVMGDGKVLLGGLRLGNRCLAVFEPRSSKVSDVSAGPTLAYAGQPTVYAILRHDDESIFVGGDFAGSPPGMTGDALSLYLPLTATWVRGTGPFSRAAYAIARLDSNRVLVGGFLAAHFSSQPGFFTMAILDRTTGVWTGAGLSQGITVFALTPETAGTVLVGGFRGVGGTIAANSGLARYNPRNGSFSRVGTNEVNGTVRAIVKQETGDILAFGDSTGSNMPCAWRYTIGSDAWTPLGNGLSGSLSAAIVRPNGDVIVGGSLMVTTPSGQQSCGLAILRQGASDWQPFEPAVGGVVYALKLVGSQQLLVGGLFGNGYLIQLSLCTCSVADIASIGGAPGGEGQLTSDDLIAFLSAFAGRRPMADIASRGGILTPDGQFTTDDVIAFLSAYFQGCP